MVLMLGKLHLGIGDVLENPSTSIFSLDARASSSAAVEPVFGSVWINACCLLPTAFRLIWERSSQALSSVHIM